MDSKTLKIEEEEPKKTCTVQWRYIFAVMSSCGFAIIYALKVNLSVAIVAMVNHTSLGGGLHPSLDENVYNALDWVNNSDETSATTAAPNLHDDTCHGVYTEARAAAVEDGPFLWNEPTQALVLSAYFWGYIVSEIPGGRMAERFSAKWVFFMAVFSNAILAIVTPPLATLSYIGVVVVRVLQGLTAGVTFPSMHVLIAKWVPPQESSVMSAIIYAGISWGTVVSLPITGALAAHSGWESLFYVMGSLSLLWCVAWVFMVSDAPQDHKFMSKEEKQFIASGIGPAEHGHPPVPWKKVFTSAPFYAIAFAHFCGNVGWYMLLVELPTYLSKILLFGLSSNSLLSSLPFLMMWIFSLVFSNRLDWARHKGWISTGTARKIATCTASLLPGICLIGVILVGCNRTGAIVFMVLAVGFKGGMFSGYLTNHIDIAPNFAGTLMALTNTVATIPGFVVPYIIGQLTHENQTLAVWSYVFYATAVVYALEAVVYVLFGSGEVQPWNSRHPVAESADG